MAGIDSIVRTTTSIAGGSSAATRFGRVLFLDLTSSTIDSITDARNVGRITEYATPDEASGTPAADAAAVYFQRNPAPPALLYAQLSTVEQNTIIIGEQISLGAATALSNNTSMSLGAFNFTVSLSTQTSLANVASALQTAINGHASVSGVEVEVEDSRLVVTVPRTLEVGAGFNASAGGLGLYGAEMYKGFAAETPATCIARLRASNPDFYYVVPSQNFLRNGTGNTVGDTRGLDLCKVAAASGRTMECVLDVVGPGALTTNETTSLGAQLHADGTSQSAWVYNGNSHQFAALSYASIFAARDLDTGLSVVNAANQRLPGVNPVSLTTTEQTELDRKRGNYYLSLGRYSVVKNGWAQDNYSDVNWYAAWFTQAVSQSVFDTMVPASDSAIEPRLIPQTDEGSLIKYGAIADVVDTGRNNGGIAPGTLQPTEIRHVAQITETPDFSGVLANGSLIHIPPYSDQSASDRAARKDQPAYVWVTLSGAINSSSLQLSLTP